MWAASTGPPAPTVVGSLVPAGVPRPVTPDQLSLQDCPVAISTDDLWGSAFLSQPASSDPPVSQGPSVPPSAAVPPVAVPCQLLPDQLQHLFEAAVQKSLSAGFRPPSCHGSVRSASSISPEQRVLESSQAARGPDSPTCSHSSQPSTSADVDFSDSGLLDDENLPPDQPAFTGLFPQSLFKSLLFKAVNSARLSSPIADPVPVSSSGSLDLMFAEPSRPVTSIPTPPLFLDVVKRQWSSLGTAPLPSF